MNGNRKRMVSLAQICTLNMGQSPSSESYDVKKDGLPFFQGNADFGDLYPVERVWCNKPTKIAHKGDILLSVRAPIGAVNLAKGDCCIGRGLAALSPIPSQCRMMYLYYALKSKVKILKQQGTGTTFKAVGKDNISALQIPLYDLEEQKQIIGKLTCIDAGIDNAHKQIAKLDTLVKSRFVEMFGDPLANPYGIPVVKLSELSSLITKGASPKWQGFTYSDDITQTLFVTSENVREGFLDLSEPKYVEDSFNNKQKRSVLQKGDVLINIVGASIGRAAKFDIEQKANINQAVALVRVNDEVINLDYLLRYLNSEKALQMYDSMKSDVARANLSLQDIGNLDILVPPRDEQNRYADFVVLADKSKLAIHKLLEKQELLRAALMQEYFG